jgi:hypothetical protein
MSTYSVGGNASSPNGLCQACPTGKTTLSTGATSQAACTATICAAGRGGSSCAACPRGWYSPGGNSSVPAPACIKCPAGQTTLSHTSSSCIADLCANPNACPASTCKSPGICSMTSATNVTCGRPVDVTDGSDCSVNVPLVGSVNGTCLAGKCGAFFCVVLYMRAALAFLL